MESEATLSSLPDDELLRRLGELVSHSRRLEADLVSHIGEVDERRLYARQAAPSMFAYCTQLLHLSEAEAYLRITVARAAREHPMLLAMLRDGRLYLSGIVKLVPLLTRDNCDALLARATHRSKREILELVAELAPRADVRAVMRKLPERRPSRVLATPQGPSLDRAEVLELGLDGVGDSAAPAPVPAPARPAVVEPLSPARYKVQFTASAELHDKLERLSALMRSEVPDGDLATIIERAVSEKLDRLEARRYAKTSAPCKGLSETRSVPNSRHIPAAVKRAVRERDGMRCRYVAEQGRRCSERDRLEFHHLHPFGLGGDHSPQNIRLMCRAHNTYLAEQDYGREAMARHRGSADRVSEVVAVYSGRPVQAWTRGLRATRRGRSVTPDTMLQVSTPAPNRTR
jgi:hypothetical protein